ARKHPLLPRDEFDQPLPISLSEIKTLVQWLSGIGDRGSGVGAQADPIPDLRSLIPASIHPLALANLLQADTLAREVSRKALRMHMHPDDENRVERLVDLFNGGFHSPMYTAGRAELHQAGLPVTDAGDALWGDIWSLVQLYQAALYGDRPDPSTPGAFFRYWCPLAS